jgi:hypothetical protein
MNKQDILDYVTKTPGNTNRAVLDTMLNDFTSDAGGLSFNSAEVTFAVTGDDETNNSLEIHCYDDNTGAIRGLVLTDDDYYNEKIGDNILSGQSETYSLFILPGKSVLATISGLHEPASITGDATVEEISSGMYNILIMGSCTITAIGER